ncbi:MAG: membrane protein insertion efficiency factor YidD [Phycisphaeraceae bacterium]
MPRFLRRVLTFVIVAVVWCYRGTLGPFLGGHCRYQPTCSQYMLDAVQKHGPVVGFYRGVRRVLRCHPLARRPYHDPA